jgi:two-component system, chemotaxis family, protein-glutamate methylesterase/glutaminase
MSEKIKVLLIEDSAFMRIVLSDLLKTDDELEFLGSANNGLLGVDKAKKLIPDVLITDMVMPDYDGLYVVKNLMRDMPIPIILLSSLERTDPAIFDALKEGAFDFIDKPKNVNQKQDYKPLTDLIKAAALSKGVKFKRNAERKNNLSHSFHAKTNYDILAIGASTGGPSAIEYILNNLPANLGIPVVIGQHMPERFIKQFADRLNNQDGLSVCVLEIGQEISGNNVFLAPGTDNIRLERNESGRVIAKVDEGFYKEYNKPSIDCLFDSIGEVYGNKAIGVVLTGMGKDGSQGLLKIKSKGGFTVAQDEASAVVYGMPKAAYESGAASFLVPLNEIPNFIVSSL